MLNFRKLYESSKELLEHNIVKEIATEIISIGKVDFSEENSFKTSDGSRDSDNGAFGKRTVA